MNNQKCPNQPKPLGEVERTCRGFELITFKDRYGKECSLQQSSLADYAEPGTSAIWLGIDDESISRMHLDREQVKSLLATLREWLAHGTFNPDD